MELITLRTMDGRYWRAADNAVELSSTPNVHAVFSIKRSGDGTVVLSTLEDRLVVARADSVSLMPPGNGTSGTRLRFIDRGGKRAALLAVDEGHEVNAFGETTFTIDTLSLPKSGCCGPTQPPPATRGADSRKWLDPAHQAIKDRAVQLLQTLSELPNVRLFLDRFWHAPKFSTEMSKALRDADEVKPFKDDWFGYHFCEPIAMQTFWAGIVESWKPYNAISEGQRYFHLSVHAARRILRLGKLADPELFAACGYYLGLSLHFLTDLTQPMHAVNFTNVLGDMWSTEVGVFLTDWRHASFEEHGDKLVKAGYLKNVTLQASDIDDAALSQYPHIGKLFREVAMNSSDVWSEILREIVETKPRLGSTWGPEVDPVFERTLKPAPKVVAKFLTYWARAARQDLALDYGLRDDTWYRLQEPTKNQSIGAASDRVTRMANQAPSNRVFLSFLADGTVAFGTEENPWRIWTMAGGGEGDALQSLPIAQAKGGTFRVAPVKDRAWIYVSRQIRGGKADGDQAMTVDPESGAVKQQIPELGPMRPPGTQETQLFRFQPDGRMTEEERAKITMVMPRDVPWWGWQSSAIPHWRDWEREPLKLTDGRSTALASRASGDFVQIAVLGSLMFVRRYFGVWSEWKPVASVDATLAGPLAATGWGRDRVEVFAMNSQGKTIRATIDGDGPVTKSDVSPETLANVRHLAAIGGPVADARLELYALTEDGTLLKTDKEKPADVERFKRWAPIPGQPALAPIGLGAAVSSTGRHVVAVGVDRQVRVAHSSQYGKWEWETLGDPGVAPAAVMIVASRSRQDVLVAGADAYGSLRQNSRFGTTWNGWMDNGSSRMATYAAAAASWGPHHVQLMTVGEDGVLCQRTYQ